MAFKRYTVLVTAMALLLATASVAQEKADLAAIWKIKDEGLRRSQVMDTLSYLSDVYGPRLTGSPNMKAANDWTQKKLAEWGLENSHLESYDFGRPGWALEKFSAHMISPTYQPLIALPKSGSPSIEGSVLGEAVLVDIRTEADVEKYKGKLKGAYVLSQPPRDVEAHFTAQGTRHTDEQLADLARVQDPGGRGGGRGGQGAQPNQQLQRMIQELYASEGVTAILEPGRGDGGTLFVGAIQAGGGRGAQTGGTPPPPAKPQVVVAVEHYNRLCRIVAKGIKVQLEMELRAKAYTEDMRAYNTIAELPGTDKKDEIVMLGAHMDSWHGGTGATDNAAGVAVTMEALRILKAIGVKPRRTIRIGLWSGEEQGLLGSRAYVTEHLGTRFTPAGGGAGGGRGGQAAGGTAATGPATVKPEHAKFAGYWNLDNGTGKIRGVYLQGNEEMRPIAEAWLAPFKDLGATTVTIRDTGGTDHQSFDAVGLPGFQFIQDGVEYDSRTHHSNMDVYDRIQRGDMMQASVIMAAFVYQTAMRDEKLPRKPQPVTRPAGTTNSN